MSYENWKKVVASFLHKIGNYHTISFWGNKLKIQIFVLLKKSHKVKEKTCQCQYLGLNPTRASGITASERRRIRALYERQANT